METLTKGEIVLFPFPFTNMKNSKLRPCLIISDVMGEDILLCQITSQLSRSDSYCITLTDNDMNDGKLLVDSYVRTNMIFTGCKELIIDRICCLNESKYREIVMKIVDIII